MGEREHSCVYGPREALEVFDYIIYVLLKRKWKKGITKDELPPPESPLRHVIECVMNELMEMGFVFKRRGPKRLAFYVSRCKWQHLFNCEWVCSQCPHVMECPLGALFKVKGWALPGERGCDYLDGEEMGKPFIKVKCVQAVFNDLLLALTRKNTLTLCSRFIVRFGASPARSRLLGKLLKYLVPEALWRRFISVCGSRAPSERYRCGDCPLRDACPYVITLKSLRGC